jgi:tetrapyrrole methylase family protein/MazG family protein
LLTGEVRSLLESGVPVLLRTRHHPTVPEIDPEGRFLDCDDLYRDGADFAETYTRIVGRVMSKSSQGDLVYAVPGHPRVAEATVDQVIALAGTLGIEVRVHAGLSYFDLAAIAAGVDLQDAQLCDALDLRIDAQRPAFVGQVFDRDRAGALKLRLLEIYPAYHPVLILDGLGTPEEKSQEVALAELDHSAFGHLACLYLAPLQPFDDVRRFDGLYAIVKRLNSPGGCPWDLEQTHESLRHYLLEEAYEALEAIDSGDSETIAEELGDVLLQVLMHNEVARRLQEFSFGDITEAISRKLIRRHPHVFGDATADTAEEVRRSWESLKKAEKPGGSILDGVPGALPALAQSQSIQGRARRIGFDWPDIEGPLAKLQEEIGEFARAAGASEREDEFGDILFVLANIGQRLGIDAEQALRLANTKFRSRFSVVEALARERGLDLKDLNLAGLDTLWDEAKASLAQS